MNVAGKTIDRAEHPAVRVVADIDRVIHLFDSMGDPWCEAKDIEQDGAAIDSDSWCDDCVKAGADEGVFK